MTGNSKNMARTHWTPQQDMELLEAVDQGRPYPQILAKVDGFRPGTTLSAIYARVCLLRKRRAARLKVVREEAAEQVAKAAPPARSNGNGAGGDRATIAIGPLRVEVSRERLGEVLLDLVWPGAH